MKCVDYVRHERLLLSCSHQADTMVLVRFGDGCSGRVCSACDFALRIRFEPDLAERVPGPADALDLLELLRAFA